METIKNYLETMFRNLPETSQVIKAKQELLQMMEDKYSELIANGSSENEAVATVISEFGNLDELAQTLNIETEVNHNANKTRRSVSLDEIKEYSKVKINSLIFRGLSIFFYITCCTPVIICPDKKIGIALLFVFIALGIGTGLFCDSLVSNWKFLKHEECSISPETIDYLVEQRKKFNTSYCIMHSLGILLCALCFVPEIFYHGSILDGKVHLSGSLLFFSLGIGIFLNVYANGRNKMYGKLLGLNQVNTIGGNYAVQSEKAVKKYKNKTVQYIMDIYWPVITCIYLIISFLTFHWEITWIFWIIASVVNTMIKNIYGEEN